MQSFLISQALNSCVLSVYLAYVFAIFVILVYEVTFIEFFPRRLSLACVCCVVCLSQSCPSFVLSVFLQHAFLAHFPSLHRVLSAFLSSCVRAFFPRFSSLLFLLFFLLFQHTFLVFFLQLSHSFCVSFSLSSVFFFSFSNLCFLRSSAYVKAASLLPFVSLCLFRFVCDCFVFLKLCLLLLFLFL